MILCALLAGGVIAFLIHMEFLGRAAAENHEKGEVLDDLEKADAARAAVEHDPAAARRVPLWSMILLPLAACAKTSRADFCAIYHPVYMSKKDTAATKRQIDGNNAAWLAVCGKGGFRVRPH